MDSGGGHELEPITSFFEFLGSHVRHINLVDDVSFSS